ncbi:D-alanyl-D-alanine carboxypeptidase [Clostridium cadaveris]|uniref:D-alanyl-D-alanine carboxypeptidase family protein n=1 Tax=Clostridium cadaveris TaxID=1529 RepID=UPI0014593F49|nr:D-alanyl-D-alanine carboxypeptidase family protein [Clostridium cadaveris]NME64409.1 D-alanyl-D-alanine carboxypeptidase [Clostridium cadaveris]NWK11967.1 D-alanyl-D-alanine carboxypeptidase [Clostridium cadaveris]
MRQLSIFILTLFMLLNINIPCSAKAAPPEVLGEGVVLMDAKTHEILYEKNMDKPLPPASTTKIMTALIVLENGNLSDKVTIGKNPPNTDGTALGLIEGETMTVEDLLNTLLIGSCNDAAVALAEYVSGSVENFTVLMNKRAKELGATNTNFKNPSGLYEDDHYISAKDMSLIMAEAIKYPEFLSITQKPHYVIKNTDKVSSERWVNNRIRPLLKDSSIYYEPIISGKTGYTIQAKHSFVSAAKKDDMTLIVSILHTDNKDRYFDDSKSLFEYGFNNFELVKLFSKGDKIKDFSDEKNSIPLLASEDFYYVTSKDDKVIKPSINIDESKLSTMSFKRGDEITTANISLNGENIGNLAVISGGDREEVKAISSKLKDSLSFGIYGLLGICIVISIILILLKHNFKKRRRLRQLQKKFKKKR